MKNELTLKELLFGEALHNAVCELKKSGNFTTTMIMRESGYPIVVERDARGEYTASGFTREGETQVVGNIPKIIFVADDVRTPSTWKTALENGVNMKRLISKINDFDPDMCYLTRGEPLKYIGYDDFDAEGDLMSAKGRTWRRYTAVRLISHSLAQYIVETIQKNEMASPKQYKKFARFTPFIKLVTADFHTDGMTTVHFKLWHRNDGINVGPSFMIDPKNKNPEVWESDIENRICRSLLKKAPDKYIVDWICLLITRVRLTSKDYPNIPDSMRAKVLSSRLDIAPMYEELAAGILRTRFVNMVNMPVPAWLFAYDGSTTNKAKVTGDFMASQESTKVGHEIMAPIENCECPVFTKAETAVLNCVQNLLESLNQ